MVGLSILSLLVVLVNSETLKECVSRNQILYFPDEESLCCDKENFWLIKISSDSYRCEEKPCTHGRVFYNGKCQDAHADEVCDGGLGKRLYYGEDGLGYCGCQEGWMMIKNNCYQEFTKAPHLCQDDDYLLRFKEPITDGKVFWPTVVNILTLHIKLKFSCIENPCKDGSLPHWTTYDYDNEESTCHKASEHLENCEVVVDHINFDNFTDPDPPLKCCTPQNRSSCDIDEEDTFLTQLSVAPVYTKRCRHGCYYSTWTKRCQGRWPGVRCRRRGWGKERRTKSQKDESEETTIEPDE